MNDLLEQFYALLMLTKSPITANAYLADLKRFVEYMQQKGLKQIAKVDTKHIILYLVHLKTTLANASVQRNFSSVKAFYRFLSKHKGITDKTHNIDSLHVDKPCPYVPTLGEVSLILEAPDASTEAGLRDKAMLELMYASGIRASELSHLDLGHYQLHQIHISCGKRGKSRTVPLTSHATEWVNRYIQNIRGFEEGPLFVTENGRRMSRNLIQVIVKRHAKNAGVKKVSPHTMRHACATHLLSNGADLRFIQALLGHATIATTERYTQLCSNTIQTMHQKFHPRESICN